MRIIITGLPFFGKILHADLKDFDSKNRYYFLDTYYSFIDRIKFAFLLPFSDLVISLNGVSDNSGSLNLAIKWRKKIMMLWQGTDVLLATKRDKEKTILKTYINYATHFSDSEQLIKELDQIGISAELLYFKHIEPLDNTTESFKTISAYSYIANGKEDFYGLNILRPLFERFKDIHFHIIGTEGKTFPSYPNVTYYGWINSRKYQEIAQNSPIFIRLTEHDGNSKSVMEAIANGSEVIWNMEHPKCHLTNRNSESVIELFSKITQELAMHNNTRNINNINWVKQNLDKKTVLTNFISTITKIGSKS